MINYIANKYKNINKVKKLISINSKYLHNGYFVTSYSLSNMYSRVYYHSELNPNTIDWIFKIFSNQYKNLPFNKYLKLKNKIKKIMFIKKNFLVHNKSSNNSFRAELIYIRHISNDVKLFDFKNNQVIHIPKWSMQKWRRVKNCIMIYSSEHNTLVNRVDIENKMIYEKLLLTHQTTISIKANSFLNTRSLIEIYKKNLEIAKKSNLNYEFFLLKKNDLEMLYLDIITKDFNILTTDIMSLNIPNHLQHGDFIYHNFIGDDCGNNYLIDFEHANFFHLMYDSIFITISRFWLYNIIDPYLLKIFSNKKVKSFFVESYKQYYNPEEKNEFEYIILVLIIITMFQKRFITDRNEYFVTINSLANSDRKKLKYLYYKIIMNEI